MLIMYKLFNFHLLKLLSFIIILYWVFDYAMFYTWGQGTW